MLHAFHIIFYLKDKICRYQNFALKEIARKRVLFFFLLRSKRARQTQSTGNGSHEELKVLSIETTG
jgi:hypothetical protein